MNIFDAIMKQDILEILLLLPKQYNYIDHLDKTGEGIYTVPMYLCYYNMPDILLQAIQFGADLNEPSPFGLSAAHIAACSYNLECLDILIKAGANLNMRNDEGETPLYFGLYNSNPLEVSKKLLDQGVDTSPALELNTIFLEACCYANLDLIKLFHATEKNINSLTPHGYSALHCVIPELNEHNAGCVKYLLDIGVDPDIRCKHGYTFWDMARNTKKLHLVEEYLEKG